MLSVFDLLEAGTLDLDLASYLMARISGGASFMVGAVPGGAGKTTVMCALLNLLPPDVRLVAATPQVIQSAGAGSSGDARCCYVCHEIGSGSYFAYLWGEDLRRYCRLCQNGDMLATNLHADTIDQAVDQVCGDNDVPPEHFRHFNLLIFLAVEGDRWDYRRRIGAVHDANGMEPHRSVWLRDGDSESRLSQRTEYVDAAWVAACREFLQAGLTARIRTIEQTRERVLAFLEDPDRMNSQRRRS
jgi:hypothetical protein